jgi:hypothetical protein
LASFAHGESNEAIGSYSHAEGYDTYAAGVGSHTEGYQTIARAPYYGRYAYNHAEGYNTEVYARGAHVEGGTNKILADSTYGHSEGMNNTTGYKYDLLPDAINTQLESFAPIASYPNRYYVDHSTESYISLTLYRSESESPSTYYSSQRYRTSGIAAHSDGYNTEARGNYSHSSGEDTVVDTYSTAGYAGGIGTVAVSEACTVIGKYNDYSRDNLYNSSKLFVVGCGNTNTRANALTVSTSGSTWIDTLYVNNIKFCTIPVEGVFFTTHDYGTIGPQIWSSSYN